MNKDSKIYVAGHRGMVGSAILRKLQSDGYTNIITKTKDQLDLTDQWDVQHFFETEKPEYVFLAAAKVGGIKANSDYRADFIYENLMIQTNIIRCAHKYGVKKLIFLGSSCIYPKLAQQPIKEEYLLDSKLESTNEAYAIAKIAGVKYCQSLNYQYGTNFVSLMPTNLYGIGDNYHLENSHVLPALIRKFHEAKFSNINQVLVWGDGTPMREFLFSDDLADAAVHVMNLDESPDLINIGSGEDLTIRELSEIIRDIINPECEIIYSGDITINGTPRKLLDVSLINSLGWKYKTSLKEGIEIAYKDYLEKYEKPTTTE